jgi:hypothetical protein
MNQEVGKSTESGSDTKLKHFIYLDRSRLHSYTAQISDGLTQIRRLSETINRKDVDNPPEEYQEESHEKNSSSEGSIGLNISTKIASKGDKKQTNKSGFKSQKGLVQESSESKNFSEDKLEHDNLYLSLERGLIEAGILTEADESTFSHNNKSRIIKITAPTRFFDWSTIHKFCEKPDDLRGLMTAEQRKGFQSNQQLKGIRQILNIFSIGELTAHLQVGQKTIVSSLNKDHLVITIDQLRAMYILPGDVNVTVVGFLPQTRTQSSNLVGLAGSLDMGDLWKAMVGEVDLVLDPIAIYSEIGI